MLIQSAFFYKLKINRVSVFVVVTIIIDINAIPEAGNLALFKLTLNVIAIVVATIITVITGTITVRCNTVLYILRNECRARARVYQHREAVVALLFPHNLCTYFIISMAVTTQHVHTHKHTRAREVHFNAYNRRRRQASRLNV